MKFEWDLNKAESNLKKHGISFDEAKSIFYDLLSVTVSDPIAKRKKGSGLYFCTLTSILRRERN